MDKSKKLIVFYLSSLACREYSVQLISNLKVYDPILFINKNHKEVIQDADKHLYVPSNKILLLLHSWIFYIKHFFILRKQIKADKSLAVYSLSFHPYNYLLARLAKSLKIDFILTVHDYTTHKGEKNHLVEWIQKKTIRTSRYVVFLSQHEADKARRDGVSNYKIKVIKHPLYNYSKIHTLVHSDKLKLLSIGRVLEYKGLNIFNNLTKANFIDHITIAGKGDYSTIDCNQNKIRCINKWLDISEIERLMMDHHLLVLPYNEASQSGILAQGFSYEIPMLISDLTGLREQISEKSAVFFDGSLAQAKIAVEKLSSSAELYYDLKSSMAKEKQLYFSDWKNSMKSIFQELGFS